MTAENRNIARPGWAVFPKECEKSLHWLVRLCNRGAAVPHNCSLWLHKLSHRSVQCWWRGLRVDSPLIWEKGLSWQYLTAFVKEVLLALACTFCSKSFSREKSLPLMLSRQMSCKCVCVCVWVHVHVHGNFSAFSTFYKGDMSNIKFCGLLKSKGLFLLSSRTSPSRLILWKRLRKG